MINSLFECCCASAKANTKYKRRDDGHLMMMASYLFCGGQTIDKKSAVTSMSLSTLLMLVSTHAALSFYIIDLTRTASNTSLLYSSTTSFDYKDTLQKCAFDRSMSSQYVIQELEQLDESICRSSGILGTRRYQTLTCRKGERGQIKQFGRSNAKCHTPGCFINLNGRERTVSLEGMMSIS